MAMLFTAPLPQVNSSGVPYSGAKLYFYQTGTTTGITTYQDSAAGTPHAQPVVADSAGEFAAIYVNTATFKVVLKDSADVTIKTIDPVNITADEMIDIAGDIKDDELFIVDPADTTKKIRFDSGNVTAGQTRVLTAPNFNGTLATLAGTETFTNKTLTTPTLTSPVLDGGVSGGALGTQAEMETGTATNRLVVVGRVQHHPGVAKVWGVFDGTAGTPAFAANYNCAGLVDNGAGSYTISIATDFSSANYSGSVNAATTNDTAQIDAAIVDLTSGSCRIDIETPAPAQADAALVMFQLFGDQ